jgi:hypothetical protein
MVIVMSVLPVSVAAGLRWPGHYINKCANMVLSITKAHYVRHAVIYPKLTGFWIIIPEWVCQK